MSWPCMFGHQWVGCRCGRPGCHARRNVGHVWHGVRCVVCGAQADLLDPVHVRELQAQGYTVTSQTTYREVLARPPCEDPLHCRGDCPACRQGPVPTTRRRIIVEAFDQGVPIACRIQDE